MASSDVAPPHHGTPLTGPETLLPDPVTRHESVSDLANPIENIPEHIGYLKELGLDYGWGTSSPMQMLLEYIHIYGGIPWYASAMLAAVMVRLLFVRRQIRASHSTAKWQQMKPITQPIEEELRAARLEGDSFKSAQLTKKLIPLRKEADLKLSNMVIPLVGQLCLGFGLWRNLRGMTELPVPALEHERFLWLSDLTVRDHTFAIALLQGVSMYMVMGVWYPCPLSRTPRLTLTDSKMLKPTRQVHRWRESKRSCAAPFLSLASSFAHFSLPLCNYTSLQARFST